MTLTETGYVELFVSDFAWEETYKPLDKLGTSRKERLRYVTKYLPKVAHMGEWRIGLDVLGHDDSAEIECTLLQASRLDGEQFLSYAAFGPTFFATKDDD